MTGKVNPWNQAIMAGSLVVFAVGTVAAFGALLAVVFGVVDSATTAQRIVAGVGVAFVALTIFVIYMSRRWTRRNRS